MDESIIQWFRNEHKLDIGSSTAESIKKSVGSAMRVKSEMIAVKGSDLVSGIPTTIDVSSDEIRQSLKDPINLIVEAVKHALERTPPELSADILDRGIILTGGGSMLKGIDQLIRERTNVPVNIGEEPLLSVVKPEPDGIGPGEEGSPPGIPGDRDPGEDSAGCSGRTTARPALKGVGGSATDTEVSRPEEHVRTVRPGLNSTGQDTCWTRYRPDAKPPPGGWCIRAANRELSVEAHRPVRCRRVPGRRDGGLEPRRGFGVESGLERRPAGWAYWARAEPFGGLRRRRGAREGS